jgi:predicted 3-demethylubiquinone-9 3-methyltransferase (glyoxalase superfamily)
MQKITPCLWFDNNAEEAMKFYTSVFKNSEILEIRHYEDAGPDMNETVTTGRFRLNGEEFMVLNAGPYFTFSPAISFFVDCENQEEVDYYWEKLSEGGEIEMCGWLKDKFGVSWQIVPKQLGELLNDKDPVRSKSVMEAMLKMKKLDIKELEKAHARPRIVKQE